MTKTVKYSRTLRVYIDGIKIHPADAHQLMMTAKKLFSSVHLIVGVPTFDGQLYEMLCQCRYVDQVIRSAPPIVDDIFLNHHQIDFVARTQCDVYGVLVAISRARRFRTNLYFQFDLRYDLRVWSQSSINYFHWVTKRIDGYEIFKHFINFFVGLFQV